jgi:hypothetical protein
MTVVKAAEIADLLQRFTGPGLTGTLSRIEQSVQGLTLVDCPDFLLGVGAGNEVLAAAAQMKRLAAQINVTIHALGILLCLPHILEDGETVEYVSLGAGNTGRDFDLETNYRVAEFKFIHWRGGAESIRQNSIFKDFFLLAESPSAKRKCLYVLGLEHPLRFLNGGRALASVLSRGDKVREQFYARFGDRFAKVRDYYRLHSDAVAIVDVSPWLAELAGDLIVEDSEDGLL